MALVISSVGASEVITRYEAIPIKVYKIVHTMGNNHPGGERGGLFILWNSSIPPPVMNAATPPTKSGSTIHLINNPLSAFIFFSFPYSDNKMISLQNMLKIPVIVFFSLGILRKNRVLKLTPSGRMEYIYYGKYRKQKQLWMQKQL